LNISVSEKINLEDISKIDSLYPSNSFDSWNSKFAFWKFSGPIGSQNIYLALVEQGNTFGRVNLYECFINSGNNRPDKYFLVGDLMVNENLVKPTQTLRLINALRTEIKHLNIVVFPNEKSEGIYRDFLGFKVVTKLHVYAKVITPSEIFHNFKLLVSKTNKTKPYPNEVDNLTRVSNVSDFCVTELWLNHKYSKESGREYVVIKYTGGYRVFRILKFLNFRLKIYVDTLYSPGDIPVMQKFPILYFYSTFNSTEGKFSFLRGKLKVPNCLNRHPMTLYSNKTIRKDFKFVLGDIDSF
jgi:hypothetical protein